jgi:hypothetical protein
VILLEDFNIILVSLVFIANSLESTCLITNLKFF